jgi:uncharacterized protein (DUF58 family)
MAVPHDRLTKLDHAIHAALLVAWVALRSGDRVGLIVFAEDLLRFLPAAPGHAQYLRLIDSLYAVQASASYVDFRELTRLVRARVPRRSLSLVFPKFPSPRISYPEEALHEIITNAVLHRDDSVPSDVHVRIFDNRVEIESP